MTDASQIGYAPNDSSKWTTGPSEVDAALDELGTRIKGEFHISLFCTAATYTF